MSIGVLVICDVCGGGIVFKAAEGTVQVCQLTFGIKHRCDTCGGADEKYQAMGKSVVYPVTIEKWDKMVDLKKEYGSADERQKH